MPDRPDETLGNEPQDHQPRPNPFVVDDGQLSSRVEFHPEDEVVIQEDGETLFTAETQEAFVEKVCQHYKRMKRLERENQQARPMTETVATMDDPLTHRLSVTEAVEEVPWAQLDPDIRPFVRKMNQLPHIQTHQSCAGHGDDEYVERCGGVWITMSPDVVPHVLPRLEGLARSDPIEHVSLTWGREQPKFSPVLRIRFQGNERGRLEESTELIYETFAEAVLPSNGIDD